MKEFTVYYRTEPTFMLDKNLTREDVLSERTHRQVKEIQAEEYGDVFRLMQGEVWSPMGEARELIQGLGLKHTSMSVGDVVWDMETDTAWQCDMVGWVEITN